MAKKEPPKPLFAVKHDFYASLDNLAQRSLMFLQVVEHALDLDQVNKAVAPMLREQAAEFRKALSAE